MPKKARVVSAHQSADLPTPRPAACNSQALQPLVFTFSSRREAHAHGGKAHVAEVVARVYAVSQHRHGPAKYGCLKHTPGLTVPVARTGFCHVAEAYPTW